MDGMWVPQNGMGRRFGRAVPWIAFALCLLIVGSVFSLDIFSLVYPQATGEKQLSGGNVVVDISNMDKGYIMVKHSGSTKRLKARITHSGTEFTYDLNGNGEYETFPLQFGSGSYLVEVFENAKGTSYSKVFNKSFDAAVTNPNAAFLCPNQYVWYTPTTAAVAKSFEICEGLTTDKEKAKALYEFVGTHVMYDYMKALTVQSGYLPSVDETLSTGMGICFDYSALLGCMMRVQGIPTQLVIGDLLTQNQYHAWNVALVDGNWVLMDATFKNSNYAPSDYAQERFY